MGIHGIYKEIGAGRRIALAKLAIEHFQTTGRPLRLAIDTSIWLFQIQASKGGSNPALRTFYYRLLRMISLNIHPLFVFDGPNKPPFKRNKRTGPNVASVPEFLAKQLLKHFSFPVHMAPGEAEAECALLQREGVVDAVLSEDVDTLMFGSKKTIRNWSTHEKTKSASPTHVNLYNADETKRTSGLDREGMILVALMSGGDYVPEGIPGCGPKIACEAARAGFGKDLCAIKRSDSNAFQEWRERLSNELKTNTSKFFRSKHAALKLPDDFPNTEILGYYTHPAITATAKVAQLKDKLVWDKDLDFRALRNFTGDAFDWRCFSGAKKFIRNLSQSLLMRELRLKSDSGLVLQIHQQRNHFSTDDVSELRITYRPIDVVNIDLSNEPPDDELQGQADDEELDVDVDVDELPATQATQATKSKPYLYDPNQSERIWVPEIFVKSGAPSLYAEWEKKLQSKSNKATAVLVSSTRRGLHTKSKAQIKPVTSSTLVDSYFHISKPTNIGSNPSKSALQPQAFRPPPSPPRQQQSRAVTPTPATPPHDKFLHKTVALATIDLTDSTQITRRRKRSPLKRVGTGESQRSIDSYFGSAITSPVTRQESTPKRSRKPLSKSTSHGNRNDVFATPTKSSIVFYMSDETRAQNINSKSHIDKNITCIDLTTPRPFSGRSRSVPTKLLHNVDCENEGNKEIEEIDGFILEAPDLGPISYPVRHSPEARKPTTSVEQWLCISNENPATFFIQESESMQDLTQSRKYKLKDIKFIDLT